MSGKLLYTLSDENPELHKQIGCLTGMFQLFDGHCFLNSPNIAGNTLKRIPEGRSQRSNIRSKPPSSESQRRAEKLRIKGVRDKQQVSSDSSRTSITFSPCSSSFSSAESSKISQQELPVFQPNGSFQQKWKGCDLRDVVRDSIDSSSSEIRQNYGFRDLQREKGNSNFLTCPQESESSRRTSTVVTKLMGLEVPAQSVVSNQNEARQIQSSPSEAIRSFSISRKAENHNENYICNSRRTTSDSYKKPIETSRFLMQPKQLDGSKVNRFFSKTKTEPRNSSVSVDGEIRKGLAELQLKKSIKDLRALEQILETLEKTQKELEIRTKKSDCTNRFQRSNSLKKLESSIVIMEPIKGNGEVSKSTSESMRNPSSVTHTIPTSNTEDNKTDRKLDKSLRKVNQRVQQKKLESDSPSRRSRQKLQNQQQADISTKISRDQKNKNHRSDVSSPMLTETNIKLDSEQHKAKQSTGLGFNEARLLTDPGKLPLEQPSPIYVLDATFYRDYSLSLVLQ